MKKIIYSFALLAAVATVMGCTKDTPPDITSGESTIRINEAHSRGKDGNFPLDWVELYNAGDTDVDISGYVLSDKADMSEKKTVPAGTILPARGFYVEIVDTDDGFGLSSDGDVVYLYNEKGENVHSIEFGPMAETESWSATPDGSTTFRMQTYTQGASNSGGDVPLDADMGHLFINEVKVSDSGDDIQDWIELYNAGDEAIDLAGLTLRDSGGGTYTIEEGSIAAKGFATFTAGTHFDFGLGKSKETVTLSDSEGAEIDHVALPEEDLEDDVNPAYARIPDGSDSWQIVALPTKGVSNEIRSSVEGLVINEVKAVKVDGGDELDFIELYNGGDQPIDLGGFKLHDSKPEEAWLIPEGTILPAGGFIAFTEDAHFSWGLGAGGDETVTLRDRDDAQVDHILLPDFADGEVSYGRASDGGATWATFADPTKGMSNTTNPMFILSGKVVINEVYTFSDQSSIDDLDWIELYNTTGEEINIGGLNIWEGGGSEEAWTIPAGTTIPAHGRIVIESDKEGLHGDPINYPSWGLSKNGDVIVLAYADLTEIDRVDVPLLDAGQSYGRVSDGDGEWQKFVAHTKNAENEGPEPGVINTTGIYVNEVYHDNTDEEAYRGVSPQLFDITTDFIELYNSTGAPVDLSGWEIYDDKMEEPYVIPNGTTIRAGGFLTYDVYKDNPNGPSLGLGVGGDAIFLCTPGAGDVTSRVTDRLEAVGFLKDEDVVGGGLGQRDFGYTVGRLIDGGNEVVIFTDASKGASNNGKGILVE